MTALSFDYAILPNEFQKSDNLALKKIFENWNTIICEYCAYEDNTDNPYWYNERATLSTFSGAIWRSNKIALEEFCCTKNVGKEEKSGRLDLWFQCGRDNSCVCEAKQNWSCVNKPIANVMTASIDDVKSVMDRYNKSIPLALTFWVPPMLPNDNVDIIINDFNENLKSGVSAEELSFYCLVAPTAIRKKAISDTGKLFPCVALLGKVVVAE